MSFCPHGRAKSAARRRTFFFGHEQAGERHMESNEEEGSVEGSVVGSSPSGDRKAPQASIEGRRATPGSGGDDGIVKAISAGDHREALILCAREHGSAIRWLCMAMVGAQAEAEDLTQETLLSAHAGFGGYQSAGSVRSWLFGIARRKCARHLEQRASHSQKLAQAPRPERAPGPEELLTQHKLAHRTRAALAEIRPSEREALILRYAGELSFRDVASACGIDEATARKRVSRALARLRAVLSSQESR